MISSTIEYCQRKTSRLQEGDNAMSHRHPQTRRKRMHLMRAMALLLSNKASEVKEWACLTSNLMVNVPNCQTVGKIS